LELVRTYIYSLNQPRVSIVLLRTSSQPLRKLTFPPRTSSPIIRHAAVWIVLEFLSSAVLDVMTPLAALEIAAADV
jgi:hypothetical protein